MHLRSSDLFWGYLANGLNIGAAILLLPLILKQMPAADVGMWILFIALANGARLLELGLRPTLVRLSAYIYSGSESLHPEGFDLVQVQRPADPQLLAELLATSRLLYVRVTGMAAAALLLGGTAFVLSVATDAQPADDLVLAWLAFALGYIISLFFARYSAILQGRGDVTLTNKIIVASRTTFLVVGALAVALDGGLIGLGIASLVAAIVDRALLHLALYARSRPELSALRRARASTERLLPVVWRNSLRLGVVHVGGYLVLSANILIASSFLGMSQAASYNLSNQLLTTLLILSGVVFQLLAPKLNAWQVSGDKEALRAGLAVVLLFAWGSFVLGALVLLLAGAPLLAWLDSETSLLGTGVLGAYAMLTLLEVNLLISCAFLLTQNRVPFVRASVVSGIGVVLLGLVLVSQTALGVWAFILAQAVVQGAYNYWRWPRQALAELDMSPADVYRYGVRGIRTVMGQTSNA